MSRDYLCYRATAVYMEVHSGPHVVRADACGNKRSTEAWENLRRGGLKYQYRGYLYSRLIHRCLCYVTRLMFISGLLSASLVTLQSSSHMYIELSLYTCVFPCVRINDDDDDDDDGAVIMSQHCERPLGSCYE